jgi:crotonobetainyl-CoA:carnitine CoA-transferase CaiB-like acyl-CoA transferase
MDCPEFASVQNDASKRAEIRKRLEHLFAQAPLDHWLALLGGAETQFAPVSSIEEALADPHNVARGMALIVETPAGPVRHIGSPIKLSATPAVAPTPARAAGSDNTAIFKELGFDDA